MHFELYNAPNTITRVANEMLKSFIGLVYLNNILIFDKNEDLYVDHIINVLEVLRANNFYLNRKKCEFLTKKLIFLGFVINFKRIVDLMKIQAVTKWPILIIVHYVRSFHGFVAFYRIFIKHFSNSVAPLINCMKKKEDLNEKKNKSILN